VTSEFIRPLVLVKIKPEYCMLSGIRFDATEGEKFIENLANASDSKQRTVSDVLN
jgi:hypothetical protein